MIDYICELWKKIKEERPLIHCITNIVTVNDCANVLLAAGASPTMAHHILEVEDVTAGCEALVCNIGATECMDAMEAAGRKASELGKPVIVDPVGAAGAAFRRNMCLNLIRESKATCIRGNYSEIKALEQEKALGAGVDVQEKDRRREDALETAADAAGKLAARLNASSDEAGKHYVVASGSVDFVSDGNRIISVYNGSKMMSKVTGMGCMSSVMQGAFLAVENSLEAAAASCVIMGICGEIAEEETIRVGGGTATFHIKFIDAVSLLTAEEIKSRANFGDYEGHL